MKKILSLIIIGAFIATSCYGAWDKTKPTDDDIRKNFPAQARANWAAIELGTDAALQVTNAKVAAGAGIVDTKLAEIGTANKVNATALKNLSGCPSGAGALPIANGGTGQVTAQAGLNALAGATTANRVLRGSGTNITLAQVDLTTDVTGTLPVGNGGTGATAAANAANGVVILNGSSQLPAVSAALLTNVPAASGSVVQVVNYQTGEQVTSTDTVPYDDTIPTSTEMPTDLITLAITPKSATNKLKIDLVYTGAMPSGAGHSLLALFQDNGASAIACSGLGLGSGYIVNVKFTHYMTAGTTSATTFKMRIGGTSGATYRMNGCVDFSSRIYGGVMASSITITEIKT